MDKPFALIVENERAIAAQFRHVMDMNGFRTEIVLHGRVALERLSKSQPDIVLLDLDLPGISGNQILGLIRKDGRLRHSKVIVVTSYSQTAESLTIEPDLLLFKPIGMEQLSDFIQRFQLKIKYQTTIPMKGEPWDRVTGLYNRPFFINRLKNTLSQSREVDYYLFSVITINIDQNNTIKNQLDIRSWISSLRETAEILKASVRPTDTVARFDQDNFHILVENISGEDIPIKVASGIQKKLNDRLTGLENKVQFPIGISILLCDRGYENVDEILKDTEIAQSLGKSRGDVFFEYYDGTSPKG
jgi:diguanylate cyclase (GGDEF)-like protein